MGVNNSVVLAHGGTRFLYPRWDGTRTKRGVAGWPENLPYKEHYTRQELASFVYTIYGVLLLLL